MRFLPAFVAPCTPWICSVSLLIAFSEAAIAAAFTAAFSFSANLREIAGAAAAIALGGALGLAGRPGVALLGATSDRVSIFTGSF